jgi:glyoxylase-like metal-dependent hydrolase (beta-lactamase superfamily II)
MMRLHDCIYLVGSGEIGLSDAWDCHVYLVDGGSELALIDAGSGHGTSQADISRNIEQAGFRTNDIGQILLTHWHPDHAGGAAQWRAACGARTSLPEAERRFLEIGSEGVSPCPVDRGLMHGDRIQVGRLSLEVIQVPGHSPGICAYQLRLDDYAALFCGDIVFYNGILGLINHEGSDVAAYRQYLPRLADVAVDALLPGHLLFALRNGQRHIQLGLDRLRGPFLPPSIGQLGFDFMPPSDYGAKASE